MSDLGAPPTSITVDDVRAALALEGFDAREAQHRMAPQPRVLRRPSNKPGQPHQASVIVLLSPGEDGLSFPLIVRAENPADVHSGQISLPGGSREPGESPLDTALREAAEELGADHGIEVLGELTPIYIPPSDFEVSPFVGWLQQPPPWRPQPGEVVKVLTMPLVWLFDAGRKHVGDWDFNGYTLRVPWYDVAGYRVWGATAILLSELEQRLRHALNGRA
jgi:8-oxo-dGTP pyrophosphatase MutT (NUDIX family)